MAKYTGSLGFKGLVTQIDDHFYIVEERKVNKDLTVLERFDLTDQLLQYVGKQITLTIKEDEELEPMDSN
jgi:hypothetical protein